MKKHKEVEPEEKPKKKPAAPEMDEQTQARIARLKARRDEHLVHARELERRIADIEAGY